MRVLFTGWAWPSHLYPMVPLAWACLAAGHEVRVAVPPDVQDVILRAGLTPVSVGRAVDVTGVIRGFVKGPKTGNGRPSRPVARDPSARTPRALSMFVDLAVAMADDLAAFARDWKPGLVVYDPTAWAGPLAAAVAGVPAVRQLYGTDLLVPARDAIIRALEPLGDKLGVGPVDPMGALTIDPCPVTLQGQVPGNRWRMRYLPYQGVHDRVPAEPPQRRDRPVVCVTWGTTMARLGHEYFLAGHVARALAGLDVEIVLAIASGQRALLGPLPPGVRVVESVPLRLLTRGADLLVHHGGAGSMLTGLVNGLPQLALPQLPDHIGHARRLAATGAGAAMEPADGFGMAEIRDTVAGLLASADHERAARRLGVEMAAHPAPATLVAELEQLAGTRDGGRAAV
ncbi:nucleotide disphospho-sugar-binding domain-containing protein [Nonomuraea sp. B5E05]|uniref:nucleotide disphospho-sugar-binding domain-containing protein n=1 Tax=Nonomuraea sp. B5E05 TaxID=3153569 RepID=UPI003261759E